MLNKRLLLTFIFLHKNFFQPKNKYKMPNHLKKMIGRFDLNVE